MASYVTPKKNAAFTFFCALEDQANAGLFKASPTLAAGDFKVSIDGGALANLTDLPTVTPSGGRMVKVTLTASEMNGDNITVVASDASGAEWYDVLVNIQTSAQQVDDLATATATAAAILVTPANKLATDASGNASANVTLWAGDAVGDAPVSAVGNGAISFPVTVNDEDSNPIDGVEVWITTDSGGTNVVAGTLSTDALGVATFMLDAGDYYVWRQASGYNFTNPVAITVS